MVSEVDRLVPGSVDPDHDAPFRVAFRNVNGIGPERFERLLAAFGTMRGAWHADSHALREVLDRRSLEHLVSARNIADPKAEFAALQRDRIDVLTLRHDAFPDLLREIPAPPPVIFLRGDIRLSDRRAVAIVGPRRATGYGKEMARSIATDLARAGVTIVSGLALGIYDVAHHAALEAGGRTPAVLGSGAHRWSGGDPLRFPSGRAPNAPNFPGCLRGSRSRPRRVVRRVQSDPARGGAAGAQRGRHPRGPATRRGAETAPDGLAGLA